MSDETGKLEGLIPRALAVRSNRILLERLKVMTDIGFHDYEVGAPQRLLVTVELWLSDLDAPADDDPAHAWDYDFLRTEIRRLAAERRYNLQETLARRIYERVAALHGVSALRVVTSKPDIYADAAGVGIEIASFEGLAPIARRES
ncbi:dihydroneopterin aldolase [Sphingomonas mesophila]|uniref:dihydroneopterin aldolase n=1 Tax=Sphingomonas mesophila TaxID=2303576 RepID=UPI000E56C31E|nr:dihydroneopterin aldolase [Sphingomonas mesophila]